MKKFLACTFLVCLGSSAVAQMPFVILDEYQHGSSKGSSNSKMAATIIRVADGDTIFVAEYPKAIRLASIDAPESARNDHPAQPYSQASKKHLETLIGSMPRTANLHCYDKDRYERLVCDVLIGKLNLGQEMVAQGLAWANTSASGRYLRSPELVFLQQQAQQRRAGLWREPKTAISPWEWRENCWRRRICQN